MTHDPRLAFLGHSTVRIDLEGVRLLTDPVLRGRIGPLERRVAPLGSDDHAGVDAVLVSHLHHDHLDLESLRLLRGEPRLIVPRGSARLLRRRGFDDVVELAPGETTHLGDLLIRATPAVHSGFRPPFGPIAGSLGFVIESDRRRIYFAGDTDLFSGMADLGELDVALVPVWGWGPTLGPGHLDPERAARSLSLLQPRLAVPIHWGTLWPRGLRSIRTHRFAGPAVEFARYAAELAPGVTVRPAEPGGVVA